MKILPYVQRNKKEGVYDEVQKQIQQSLKLNKYNRFFEYSQRIKRGKAKRLYENIEY